jgi:hypothetical protein
MQHGLMFTNFAASNVTIENNVLARITHGLALNVGGASSESGFRIFNNTVFASRYGVQLPSDSVVRNNIFDRVDSGSRGDHNLVGATASWFVDTERFELAAGSPAIDRGSATGVPGTDRLGRARVDDPSVSNGDSIVDIGAHERHP